MKNAYNVPPTRYMNRKDIQYVTRNTPKYGPVFGDGMRNGSDICIADRCNIESCSSYNDGEHGYECHPQYKFSLFTSLSSVFVVSHRFVVSDYEVFSIDHESKEYVYSTCMYPNIIWEYIQTRDISEHSLKKVRFERELRSDLETIDCNDSKLLLKIYQHFFIASKLLVTTQLVSQQYDSYLRIWFRGAHKWKLIYRASEHGYTAGSFHEYCDNKGPTLIIIKSSEGWIFGGYTTQSWSGRSMNDILCLHYNRLIKK